MKILTFIRAAMMLSAICLLIVSSNAFDEPRPAPETEILRTARKLFILAKSDYFSPPVLERELLRQPEFQAWGMTITRDQEDSELILQVNRKKWSTYFTITVLDPRSNHVIVSCEETSLGGTIEPKLAKCFIKRIRAVRALPTAIAAVK